MDRSRIACYALLASAFVLTGMLVTQIGSIAGSTAQADMVISRANFSLMTANTLTSEEAVFVLDNANNSLMVYTLNLGRKRLELAGGAKLSAIFQSQGGPVTGARGQQPGGR